MRLPRPSAALTLTRPRHELALLVLIAVATLTVVVPVGAQDVSRFCLTRALEHGTVSNDACLRGNFDLAEYRGHLYSDKAPGISALALPAAEAVGLGVPSRWDANGDLRVWAVRLLSGGLGFLVIALLVGRAAEGLSPGAGGRTLVACSVGTLIGATAVAGFEHDTAAALAFAGFLLAWRRRPLAAGLTAGLAVVVGYEAGLAVVAIGAYVLLQGAPATGRYVAGLVPGALLLSAYNWAAFGSPLHLSYRYIANAYASDQRAGFFGISFPRPRSVWLTMVGDRGLLLDSPVLLAAVVGLWLLWRKGHRAEALVAAALSLAFLLVEFGYFNPYGGDSPGPRFLVPAIPFAALGLALTFAEWPVVTSILAALSIIATTVVSVTWPLAVNSAASGYRQGVWGELARLLSEGGGARITTWPARNVLNVVGIGNGAAAVICCACAACALGIAVLGERWDQRGTGFEHLTPAEPAPPVS